MRILIIGSGGREHALVWRVAREHPGAHLFVAPGNGGTKALAESVPLKPEEMGALADFAASRDIDLTLVGPEAPLAAGMVDAFVEKGLTIFGPTQAAAEIESSKAFAKQLMEDAGIPTARHRTFDEFEEAEKYIRARPAPLVVKTSGLAAGKGSIVCDTTRDAVDAAREMLVAGKYGEAGATIVVEEYLNGEELSVLFLTDGKTGVPLLPSQDHKPIGEGDEGPNTGGMGAYAPVSIADDRLIGRTIDRILMPALSELRKSDRTYRGVLYCGLMIVDGDPFVVEFNCRFGDPETQAILPLVDGDLLEAMERIARKGEAKEIDLEWQPGASVCTVLASEGYPGEYEKGETIQIPEELKDQPDVLVFHAGTRVDPEGRLVTDGGRVLGVVGLGPDIEAAATRSRDAAAAVDFEGKYFRRDIGYREIARHDGE